VAVASGFGAIWVVDAGDRQLRQLSPTDGHELRKANTSLDPIAVVTTDRYGCSALATRPPTATTRPPCGRIGPAGA
jgi:hypothetical protein